MQTLSFAPGTLLVLQLAAMCHDPVASASVQLIVHAGVGVATVGSSRASRAAASATNPPRIATRLSAGSDLTDAKALIAFPPSLDPPKLPARPVRTANVPRPGARVNSPMRPSWGVRSDYPKTGG